MTQIYRSRPDSTECINHNAKLRVFFILIFQIYFIHERDFTNVVRSVQKSYVYKVCQLYHSRFIQEIYVYYCVCLSQVYSKYSLVCNFTRTLCKYVMWIKFININFEFTVDEIIMCMTLKDSKI